MNLTELRKGATKARYFDGVRIWWWWWNGGSEVFNANNGRVGVEWSNNGLATWSCVGTIEAIRDAYRMRDAWLLRVVVSHTVSWHIVKFNRRVLVAQVTGNS
jgi:hypothetical protein